MSLFDFTVLVLSTRSHCFVRLQHIFTLFFSLISKKVCLAIYGRERIRNESGEKRRLCTLYYLYEQERKYSDLRSGNLGGK